MMNQFNLRRVMSKCSRPVLADLFEYHGGFGHDIGRTWLEDPLTHDEDVFKAYLRLPTEMGKGLETDLHNAHVMATPGGMEILLNEASIRDLDLAGWNRVDGLLERALWFSINHPAIWEAALHFGHADALQGGRYWIKRGNLPAHAPDLSEAALKRLGDAISAYFTNQEGRGQQALVDHYSRPDGAEYFFVYLSDFADAYHGFANDGTLQRTLERRAFEIIYAFHREGSLELYAKGCKQVVQDLQTIFCRAILHEDILPSDDKPEYNLDMLLDPYFAYPTDPEDGIERVAIQGIVCRALGRPKRCTITITSPVEGGYASIHDALSNDLSQKRLPRELLHVIKATLCFHLTGWGIRSMKVTISLPNRSDLKSKRDDLAALGRKYLQRWGIDNADYT